MLHKNCLQCKKLFYFRNGGAKRTERTKFCSKPCLYKYLSETEKGEGNRMWKGGSYGWKKYGSDFRGAKKAVIKKYGKKCFECKSEIDVEIHHINKISKDNKIENLIPLCSDHHYAEHMDDLIQRGKLNNFVRPDKALISL